MSVRSASGGYRVCVGGGVRRLLTSAVAIAAPSGRCALITDHNVQGLWGPEVHAHLVAAGIDVVTVSFPAGEARKTRETWAHLTDSLLEARVGRDSCVVSLGGGVVGDVAGFVAATYLRGIPFIQVPTTTLAMIDASVGGKTGVDHALGKNLVGAFHAPEMVLADPDFLVTLGRRARAEGFAEAVKHGVIVDADYGQWLASRAVSLLDGRGEDVERAVVRSVEIKAGVVSADEFEAGHRQVLNFGHTVGHALEADSGYKLSHGHAVAVGMVAEARVGEELSVTARGTTDQVRRLVRAFGLPDTHDGLARPRQLADRMTRDKKTRSGVVHLVRLEELGRVGTGSEVTIPVEVDDLVRMMEKWR
ncbi:MAG: 3-dehydroquinate synthase [Gemmatimonadetes bacterium]|nr:3-dehydroquinate synthase [Gemmatimonadota bacterium]